jgi:P27 family predicted phage terminase small subunit
MENHVKPIAKIPESPADFDAEHRAIWDRTCGLLFKHKILTDHDLDAVRMYCELTILRRDALAEVKKDGLSYTTDSGQTKPHPSIASAMQFNSALMSLIDRFGFNPKARQSLKIGEEDTPEDKLGDFLN